MRGPKEIVKDKRHQASGFRQQEAQNLYRIRVFHSYDLITNFVNFNFSKRFRRHQIHNRIKLVGVSLIRSVVA